MDRTGIEDLVREISQRHGITVGPDDPILILHTLNQRLLADNAAKQESLLDSFQQSMEAASSRWSQEAGERSDRMLGAALNGASNQLVEAAAVIGDEAAQALRTQAQALASTARTDIDEIRKLSKSTFLAAGLVLVAAIVTLIAAIIGR